jgi:SAM-dependent methyltransferase
VQRFERLATLISQYSPGNLVFEIGPGDGELAAMLVGMGVAYSGVERKLRAHVPNVIEADFFEFESDARFDCVVTQYVLHHAESIDDFVKRMLRFTKPKGIIAIGEYGWERSDDPAFREDRANLHTSETMIRSLDTMLERLHYEDVPYKDGNDKTGFIWLGRPRPRRPTS